MARIFIAIPQYKPMAVEREMYLADLFGIKGWEPMGFHPQVGASLLDLKATRHQFVIYTVRNDGLIDRSISNLLGWWLHLWKKGDKYDYFLRLDEDLEFHHSAIQSMIDADKPIIGAAYAYKTTSGFKFRKSVCKYLQGEVPDKNGILKVLWLNGGFQFFRSDALLKLMEGYPELRYDRVAETKQEEPTESYALFTIMLHQLPNSLKIMLSEDYAICQRAIDIGMEIYLDTKVQLCHWDGNIGYMIGKDPITVTKENPPWENSTTEIISRVA